MKPELILYEDNHLLVYNKQPGDIVQGDKTGDEPLSEQIKEYLKKKFNKPGNVFLGVIHRIDRPASGIVIFARTSKSLSRMNELLKRGEIRKTYLAVVQHQPPELKDHLVHFLVRNEKQNKSYAHLKEVDKSKRAELIYEMKSMSDRYYLLEINLLTGRHHQIRSQLAFLGCPIKGDLKYGSPRSNTNASIHLHARSVEFIHPVQNEPVKIVAGPPSDVLWDHFCNNNTEY